MKPATPPDARPATAPGVGPGEDFSSLFEFMPVGAFRSTPDGHPLRVNAAMARLSGFASETEMLAQLPDIATGWYVDPTRRRAVLDALERDGSINGLVSEVYRHPTRERIWVRESAQAVRDASGRTLFYEGIVEEVTDRLEADAARRRSDELLRDATAHMPGVVFQVHINHRRERRYVYVSEGVREIFGVEPEAVLADGELLKRFRHPDDAARVTRAMGGPPGSRLALEYRIVLDDGRVKWVHLNSSPTAFDAEGELRTAVMVDITSRVQADAALREQEERWKLALDSAGDGVWDWDLVTNTKTLSARCKDMYGLTDAGTLAHDALDRLVHPDDLPQMLHQRDEHLAGRTPNFVNERRVQCADGSWKWILSRGMVIQRDATGRPLRMIGTHTDITERKQADTLRQERDRAEAASRATTQFLSRVSHELRTPLNAVLGFAQLLELDAAVPPQQRAWVAQILQSGRHLLGLVDDVLDLSSVQTGQFAFACTEVDLGQAVHEAWSMLAADAAEAGLAYVPALPATPLLVRADARRLRQVLSNLLHNAIKYNRPGGRVSVDAAHVALAVELRVHDTGPGLSEDEIGRIFMPFERLGAQRGTIPGTGLGLALSRQLTEAMGGGLRVQSRPGAGATFILTLPAARDGSGAPGSVQAWPTDSAS